jgi:hypothetical protein
MPDTIAHATQGGLILLGPFIAFIRRRIWIWILVILGGLFGALPDLLGAYGFLVKHDHGALYFSAHHGAIAETLQYVPMYWLHLRLDSITHGRHSMITPEYVWIEVVVWTVNLMLMWWFAKIWRTNQGSILPQKADSRKG